MKIYCAELKEYDSLQFIATGEKKYISSVNIFRAEPIEPAQLSCTEASVYVDNCIKEINSLSPSLAYFMCTISFESTSDTLLYEIKPGKLLLLNGEFWEK